MEIILLLFCSFFLLIYGIFALYKKTQSPLSRLDMEINWNKYKIKDEAPFKDKFINYLNLFKKFLEKYEVKLLKKSEQTEYLLAKKNYINCFEKDNSYPPERLKDSRTAQLIKYRHQLLKLTIKASEFSDKLEDYLTNDDKFEDINKAVEKYRPFLYETNVKEKPRKTIQTKNESSLKELFPNTDVLTRNISRLKELYNKGTLTKAEFEQAKNKLLK